MSSVAADEDEYYVEGETLRTFIAQVKDITVRSSSPLEATQALMEPFARLLADRSWLPLDFRQPAPQSGMGGGIGQWLLYRSADRSLTLFSLVVPPGSATPVHDHLAWGLVGLYEGAQEERVYQLTRSFGEGHGELELSTVRHLQTGDFYPLIPPQDDIHRVMTTSSVPSISLHLLARDVGCIWRHQYEPEHARVQPFRSGYTNVACEDEQPEPSAR
jgi:predicted metal-dependent enzyme (double-stranded beta helix superfamily)